jgi:hypothetical protein
MVFLPLKIVGASLLHWLMPFRIMEYFTARKSLFTALDVFLYEP